MADKTYVVTAACAVVYNTDHSQAVTVQRGGAVPADADPDHVQHLLDRGMIAEGEPAGGLAAAEDERPPFPLPDEADQPDKSRSRRSSSDKDDAKQ
jgi:hypothetical protein